MAEGDRPLAVKTVRVWAARGEVMGDALDGGEVGRALIKT